MVFGSPVKRLRLQQCINGSYGTIKYLCQSNAYHLLDDRMQFSSKCNGDGDGIKKKLIKPLKRSKVQMGSKISVVGAGAVGMACVFALLSKSVTNHLCLVDLREDWCKAERLDLLHGSAFLNNPCLNHGCNMAATKNSRIIVMTAGARPKKGQTRLDVAQMTADIVKDTIPCLVKYSPNAIYLVASNPADVMTWVAQKVSGLPIERISGPGTNLDTARFRLFIAQRLQVAPSDVNGWIIGEHGGTSVPLWSSVTIGGALLSKVQPLIGLSDDPEKWNEINAAVVNAAFDVINVKGYTNWAIGLSVADVCKSFLSNSGNIRPLSTNVKGLYKGFDEDVFMSLPVICRGGGIAGVIKPPLSECETSQLKKSYDALFEAQCAIKF